MIRRLRARSVWDWWTATGVIPRWQLIAVYVLVVAAGAAGMTATRNAADRAQAAVDDNCARIHRIVTVGGDVIASGRADLVKYRDEGLLTDAQYRRAVEETNRRLVLWRSADCRHG